MNGINNNDLYLLAKVAETYNRAQVELDSVAQQAERINEDLDRMGSLDKRFVYAALNAPQAIARELLPLMGRFNEIRTKPIEIANSFAHSQHIVETATKVNQVLQLVHEKINHFLDSLEARQERSQQVSRTIASHVRDCQEIWSLQPIEERQNRFLYADRNGLKRSIQVNLDGTVYVHFTRTTKDRDHSIGTGSYKKAKLAIKHETGEYLASIGLKNGDLARQMVNAREIRNLEQFKGVPGFIQIHSKVSYRDHQGLPKTRLLLDLYDKDLSKAMKERSLTVNEKHEIACQLVVALTVLHQKGYLHRDLKPNNIFLKHANNTMMAVIGDLGSVCEQGDVEARKEDATSPLWVSPEYAKARLQNTSLEVPTTDKHDVWSMGLILYEMYQGLLPWRGIEQVDAVFQEILNKTALNTWPYPEPSDKKSLAYLLWGMLQADPQRRFSSIDAFRVFLNLVAP